MSNNGSVEKRLGWKLLVEAAERITEIPQSLIEAGGVDAAYLELVEARLGVQVVARQEEIIPDDHLEEVLGAVFGAVCRLPNGWCDDDHQTFVDFFLDREGYEKLKGRVARTPGWGLLELDCVCGNPAHRRSFSIATVENIEAYQRQRAERQLERQRRLRAAEDEVVREVRRTFAERLRSSGVVRGIRVLIGKAPEPKIEGNGATDTVPPGTFDERAQDESCGIDIDASGRPAKSREPVAAGAGSPDGVGDTMPL